LPVQLGCKRPYDALVIVDKNAITPQTHHNTTSHQPSTRQSVMQDRYHRCGSVGGGAEELEDLKSRSAGQVTCRRRQKLKRIVASASIGRQPFSVPESQEILEPVRHLLTLRQLPSCNVKNFSMITAN
jgi:hypothetical protein